MESVRPRRRPWSAVLVLLTVIAVVVAALLGGQRPSRAAEMHTELGAGTRPAFVPGGATRIESGKPGAHVKPAAPAALGAGLSRPAPALRGLGVLTVRIPPGTTVALRANPAGRQVATLGPETEFGSPRVLSVVTRRGRWLGVHVPELPNGTLGWVDGWAAPLVFGRTTLSVRIDLSERRLVVRDGKRILREAVVAVGTASTPTPTGRFAVTDLLDGAPWGGTYGCCIVALTATQPRLASGWQGGNRIAIHGTSRPETVGQPVSNGCLRAHEEDLRFLLERLPLGTPVTIVA